MVALKECTQLVEEIVQARYPKSGHARTLHSIGNTVLAKISITKLFLIIKSWAVRQLKEAMVKSVYFVI